MERAFDKHGWLQAVQAHTNPKFTDRDFRIAFLVCSKFTRREGIGWVNELQKMAKEMPDTPNLERFRKSLDKLVKAGFLQETHRSVGGRGLKSSRAYNLCKPVTLQSQVSETRDPTVQNPGPYGTKPVTVQSGKNPPELGEDPPKGTSEGTPKGTRRLSKEVKQLLRQSRESGDVFPLRDYGLFWECPDPPIDMTLPEIREMNLRSKREWIDSLLAESA